MPQDYFAFLYPSELHNQVFLNTFFILHTQFVKYSDGARELLLSQNAKNSWLLGRILHFDPPKGKIKLLFSGDHHTYGF